MNHYVRVRVEHGNLETIVAFFVGADDDSDVIYAKARRLTTNLRTLPMAYERITIVERRASEAHGAAQ